MTGHSRHFDRRAAANTKKAAAAALDRLGLSDPMWESLQALHLARLTRERGQRAPMAQTTLVALQRRNLASYTTIDGEDPIEGDVLWSCTAEGAELVTKGRPE
jgi:hypothetical protein